MTTSRRARRLATAGLALGLLLAVAPATAMAGQAFVTTKTAANGEITATALYRAAPGEDNDLRVHGRSGERFDFRDSANKITPGRGCKKLGGAVRCEPRSLNGVDKVAPASASTGDLNDEIEIVRGRASVNGGSGNDTLTTTAEVRGVLAGGSGNDLITTDDSRVGQTLNGGGNNDVLIGTAAGDSLAGGPGDDNLQAGDGDDIADGDSNDDNILGGDGDDQLRGGTGNDRVLGNNGRDRIRGQFGNDRIAGGRNNDRLGGGPGRDRLFGNTGRDLLVGNGGRDRFRAGPNNDRVRSVDGIRERINCGSGFDRARVDRVPRDRTAFCNLVARITFRR